MEPVYRLKNLKQAYNGAPVLDIPGLSIDPQCIVGIVGPNGSGKSTLIRLLAFLDKPRQGEIFFKGQCVEKHGVTALRRRITLLTQDPFLLRRSVFDNVAFGLRLRRTNHLRDAVHQSLELVGLPPGEFAKRLWYELSGGETQRVALAARLALKPEVLLLDEPTASLDEMSADLTREAALAARHLYGTTLVIVSHDKTWLNSVSDQIIHMRQGRIIGE